MKDFIESLVALILLPVVLVIRLISLILIIVLITSPLILIGWLIWVVGN